MYQGVMLLIYCLWLLITSVIKFRLSLCPNRKRANKVLLLENKLVQNHLNFDQGK